MNKSITVSCVFLLVLMRMICQLIDRHSLKTYIHKKHDHTTVVSQHLYFMQHQHPIMWTVFGRRCFVNTDQVTKTQFFTVIFYGGALGHWRQLRVAVMVKLPVRNVTHKNRKISQTSVVCIGMSKGTFRNGKSETWQQSSCDWLP